MSNSSCNKRNPIIRILMFTVWFLVLIAEGFFVARNFGNPFQILVPPVIGLTFVFIIEYFAKLQVKSKITVYLRRIAAIPYFILGFGGITTFTLTAYRNNHQPFIIPLATIFLTIGLMLTHYKIYRKTVEVSKHILEIAIPDSKNKKSGRTISIIMVWVLVFMVNCYLAIKGNRDMLNIFMLAVIGVILIFTIGRLAKAQVESKITVYLRRIAAIPYLMFGFAGIINFVTRPVRDSPAIITVTIISLTIGLMLIHYNIYKKPSTPAKRIGEDEIKSSHPEEDKL